MKIQTNSLHIIKVEPYDNMWEKVIAYVHERYAIAFDADLNTYMPHFMALVNENNTINSLCGFREANACTPLFLEYYLDTSAEEAINQAFNKEINREKLVEFGQLASFSRGISAYHFLLMTEELVKMGYEWCIFTATDLLHGLIQHMGLKTEIIAYADPNRIPNAQKIWGHYYEHHPRIVAGNLVESAQALRKYFNAKETISGVLVSDQKQAV